LSHTRYTLKDPDKFRWVMENPGRGAPYSVRTLAEASGCGPGLIQKLANGKQPTADVLDAHAIAEALGVAVLVLFAPPVTPNCVTVTTDDDPEEE
jgi:transcriptional regulator with XRE-family HTH domain